MLCGALRMFLQLTNVYTRIRFIRTTVDNSYCCGGLFFFNYHHYLFYSFLRTRYQIGNATHDDEFISHRALEFRKLSIARLPPAAHSRDVVTMLTVTVLASLRFRQNRAPRCNEHGIMLSRDVQL
jgi:hypothetical protein